jgi:hypothetical protein
VRPPPSPPDDEPPLEPLELPELLLELPELLGADALLAVSPAV